MFPLLPALALLKRFALLMLYHLPCSNVLLKRALCSAIVFGIGNVQLGFGQSNQNYISTQDVQVAGQRLESDLIGLPNTSSIRSRTYVDGLGRPNQTVIQQASPDGRDVVQPIEYDALGRVTKSYLPYVSGTDGAFKADALLPNGAQSAFYRQSQDKIANDDAPYSQAVYENSPSNRIIEQGFAGQAWQPVGGGSGATIRITTRGNYAWENIKRWSFSYPQHKPIVTGLYADAQLSVTISTNEHQYTSTVYLNEAGQQVCQKVQRSANEYITTYYIHDDFGKLRVVVQPEGVKTLMSLLDWNTGLTADFLAKWCFRYNYDDQHRLTERYVPGGGWSYLVYDRLDRLVGHQSQKESVNSDILWHITKYDELGRPILTAYAGLGISREELQGELDGQPLSRLLYESRNTSTIGYTLTQSYPVLSEANVQTLTYYDDHTYPLLNSRPFIGENGISSSASSNRMPGLVTGQAVRVLAGSFTQWLVSKSFYDDQLRPIQEQTDNYPTGATRITIELDDFLNRPKATLVTQTWGANTHSIRNRFIYDGGGRVTRVFQQMEHSLPAVHPEILLAQYEYNALGQLVDKKLHSTDGGANFLQSVDFRYNIRGWLTSINNRDLIDATWTETNDDGSTVEPDLFGLELKYNDGLHLVTAGSQAQLNGNIAEALWRTRNPTTSNLLLRGYAYTYDGINRLKNAAFRNYEYTGSGYAWGTATANYSVGGITYDDNGNILTLNRKGLTSSPAATAQTHGDLDVLQYYYNGNRLRAVDDQVNNSTPGHDFEDNGSKQSQVPQEYHYDENGSMTADGNKGIQFITYNYLNLPESILFSNGGRLDFIYSAGGEKLRKTASIPGQPSKVTDYVAGFVYEDGQLVFVPSPEGRVLFTPVVTGPISASGPYNWKYEYHIKDHLGNLRFAFRDHNASQQQRTAGMEPANAPEEEQEFKHLNETRTLDALHARTGQYVARLNASIAGHRQGPTLMMPVAAGDSVAAEVYGRYPHATPSGRILRRGAIVAGGTLASAPPVVGENSHSPAQRRRWIPFVGVSLAIIPQLLKPEREALPDAYLRVDLFNRDSQLVATRVQPMRRTSTDEWQALRTGLHADSAGFISVSLVNESGTDADFDDLALRPIDPLRVQENHYDPFGLNLVGIETAGQPDSKFQFGGKEKQEEFGLNWNDHGARYYDPQLGRWHASDPLAEYTLESSPFAAFDNNPLSRTDPTGMSTEGWFRNSDNADAVTYRDNIHSQADLDKAGINGQYIGESIETTFSDGSSMTGSAEGKLSFNLSEAVVLGNKAQISNQALIGAPGLAVGSTAAEAAVAAEGAAVSSTAAAFAASTGILSLATLQGDTRQRQSHLYLGYIPNSKFGHNIVGLDLEEQAVHWYEQTTRGYGTDANGRQLAAFREMTAANMRLYQIIGLRVEKKTISRQDYINGYTTVLMQIAAGSRPYNQFTNSCVTNVRPVLSAAGYNAPQYVRTPRGLQNWFESKWFPWMPN